MKTLIVLSTATILSGCFTASAPYPNQYGSFALISDAAGMRAYGDSLNALVTNGKASPNRKTPAWTFRTRENQELTVRRGFLSGLFPQPLPSATPATQNPTTDQLEALNFK